MPIFEFPFRNALGVGGALTNQGSGISLTANGDYCAFVMVAEATITAKKIGFRTGTTVPSGKQIKYSIQTVGTDGLPTGTTVCSQTSTANLTASAWNEFTFATTGTLNRGTTYAVVIEANDTGWSGSTLIIQYAVAGSEGSVMPYIVSKTAGGAASVVGNRALETFYIVDDAGSPSIYGWPFQPDAALSMNTAPGGVSTPDELGMQFLIPTTVCSTYKLEGIKLTTNNTNNTSAPNIGIAVYNWNNGNYEAALETTTFPPLQQATISIGVLELYFDNPPTLTTGNRYVVSVYTTDPSFTTASITQPRSMTVSDTLKPAMWDNTNAFEWNRVSRILTTDNWTTTADSLMTMGLILSIQSLPSGGGLLVHPGMTGRVNG